MRADALRNREAILAAARQTFEEQGVLASLDGIAGRAGVGNATLYRNFPTRDDLLAAVMALNLANLIATARDLSESLDAKDALKEWLFRLTWQLRIWHDLPHCVASAQTNQESSINAAILQILAETEKLLYKAKLSSLPADDVTAADLFELVTTLSWGVDRFGDDEPKARRRVTIATAGIFTI
jgi:AcrR family transcriptional regulator